MATVRVVTDSTADLAASWREQHGVSMVPLKVIFGQEAFLDQVELDSGEFFARLVSSRVNPYTSQPAPADFVEVYRELARGGNSIVSIHISSHLSGTIQSAQAARAMLPELDLAIVDSRSASLGLGLVVMEAARAAARGAGREEVAALARQAAARLQVFWAVDTLEYLHRNGRIGKAQALVGTLLNFKPILWLDDGVVAPYDKVRGRGRVIPRLVEAAGEKVPFGSRVKMAVLHASYPEGADRLREEAGKAFQVEEVITGQVGPVIGTHVGPGLLGLSLLPHDPAGQEG